jgi:hypothetical protein
MRDLQSVGRVCLLHLLNFAACANSPANVLVDPIGTTAGHRVIQCFCSLFRHDDIFLYFTLWLNIVT